MRTPDQITVDRALLITLLDLAQSGAVSENPHQPPLTDVKLQQLAFLCELEMFNKGIKGFHFEFFRFAYGAFSKDLDNDLLLLRRKGRVENFRVTEEAREVMTLLEEASRHVEANEQTLAILEAVVTHYGPQDTGAITQSVEAVELSTTHHPEVKLAIRDISFHSSLLVPHRIEVQSEFTLPRDVLAKLRTAMGY
jgi:hypothetical protein